MKIVPVKFTQHFRSFNPDEVAGFPEHIAKDLIEAGVAVYLDKSIDRPPEDKMVKSSKRK